MVMRLALAGVGLALLLGSCGGEEVKEPGIGAGSNGIAPGSLGKLTCGDWQQGTLDTRDAIIDDLRIFAGGPVSGEGVQGTGPVLDDEQAYELFENRCEEPFAEHFLLYKLYTHAAGFAGS